MKIVRIAVNVFEHPTRLVRDSAGHAHASRGAPGKARLAMLRLATEDGTEGYSFGSPEVISMPRSSSSSGWCSGSVGWMAASRSSLMLGTAPAAAPAA